MHSGWLLRQAPARPPQRLQLPHGDLPQRQGESEGEDGATALELRPRLLLIWLRVRVPLCLWVQAPQQARQQAPQRVPQQARQRVPQQVRQRALAGARTRAQVLPPLGGPV